MDELVRVFHGGMVKENGEFENMVEDIELFDSPPLLKDLVDRVVSKHSCGIDEISLRGRFDCGKARAHYVLMTLESEMHWRKYKDIVARANVICLEVVVELTRRTRLEEPVGRVDEIPFPIENMTQESTFVEDVPNPTCASDYDMTVASDHFGPDSFEAQDDMDAADDDDISLGSEDSEYDSSDEDDGGEDTGVEEREGNGVEAQVEQENDAGDGANTIDEERGGDDESRDGPMGTAVNNADQRFSYTAEELHMLKLAHVEVPAVSNAKDLSRIDRAICDSTIFESECVIDSDCPEIRKGMKFNSLPELQFFLADYAVRHHRPFYVVHSDKRVRYDVLCKQGCLWGVWARIVSGTGQWKITNVKQPHTCASSKPKQVHAQCTARYLAHRILGIVQKDSDTSVPSLMESIFALSSY